MMLDPIKSQPLSGWGVPVIQTICPVCDWSFLVLGDNNDAAQSCPYCFQAELAPVEFEQDGLSFQYNPELMILPTVTAEKIGQGIENFAGDIPYPPEDLKPEILHQRLRLFYLPVWLVDCSVSAIWDAEAGFDYDVVSHQERYTQGQWVTQEVNEARIRWEPRVGRLQRTYDNVSGPALEIHSELWDRLGRFRINQAQGYSAEKVKNSLVRLPDQSPEEVWLWVKPTIQKHAAAEVRTAMKADHIRKFRWSPNYQERNWTLLLVPVYSTYYMDDSSQPQPVLVHAGSGQVDGVRRSSMKRAQRLTVILAFIALAGFILSLALGALGIVIPPLVVASVIGGLISAGVGIGAFIPMLRSWRFNLHNKIQQRSIPST